MVENASDLKPHQREILEELERRRAERRISAADSVQTEETTASNTKPAKSAPTLDAVDAEHERIMREEANAEMERLDAKKNPKLKKKVSSDIKSRLKKITKNGVRRLKRAARISVPTAALSAVAVAAFDPEGTSEFLDDMVDKRFDKALENAPNPPSENQDLYALGRDIVQNPIETAYAVGDIIKTIPNNLEQVGTNFVRSVNDAHDEVTVLAQNGDIIHLQHLLSGDVDINRKRDSDGYTALHIAVERGDVEMVKMLLADPRIDANAKAKFDERTPLMIALDKAGQNPTLEQKQIIELMTKSEKIDLNAVDTNGKSVFLHAVQAGNMDCAVQIKDHVNIQQADKSGRNAVHYCVGNPFCMATVLEMGVYSNTRDDSDRTPLEKAKLIKGNELTVELLTGNTLARAGQRITDKVTIQSSRATERNI